MFDFGSGIRYEGDLRGVNTKGLVTFDRQTRKDPFYFYKANWSAEPVTHIVGRRYTDRAYAVTDVKVYSNADAVQLVVNGEPIGSRSAAQCPLKTCVFARVALRPGKNVIAARGTRGSQTSADEVAWTLADADHVNIAAGQLATGLKASDGTRFGSDNFFSGGTGRKVVQQSRRGDGDASPIKGVAAPADAELYATYREGRFRYDIPLANGAYRLVLGFVEPSKDDGRRWPGVRRRGQRRQGHHWPRRAARGRGVSDRRHQERPGHGLQRSAGTRIHGHRGRRHRFEHRHLEAVTAQTGAAG